MQQDRLMEILGTILSHHQHLKFLFFQSDEFLPETILQAYEISNYLRSQEKYSSGSLDLNQTIQLFGSKKHPFLAFQLKPSFKEDKTPESFSQGTRVQEMQILYLKGIKKSIFSFIPPILIKEILFELNAYLSSSFDVEELFTNSKKKLFQIPAQSPPNNCIIFSPHLFHLAPYTI